MTRLLSLSPKAHAYESTARFSSRVLPGVIVTILRMSLGRRIELAKQVRELGNRVEFHEAGEGLRERVEASVIAGEIDATYLRWGLADVDGLTIDGKPAACEDIIAFAPEEFVREVLGRIRAECGLTDEEVKN
jgi:hypothetical protein